MPGSTKANKTSDLNNICTYRSGVPSSDHVTPFECPSDLAIRCISDILTEISELDTPKKQIEKFHKIIEKSLNKLCLGNKSQKRIQCFWSLYEKSKITDKDIPSGSTAKDIINQAIGRANDRYHSGNLLEKLVRLEIGTGHVFDIIPHENKINFKAYSRLGMELPVIPEYFEYLLSNPDIQPFDLFIEKLVEIAKKPSANIEDLIVLVNQEIIGYCDSWKITGNAFSKTLKESNNFFKQKPINEDAVAEACAHFALISLYSKNNTFSHASYILATTFRGQPHSSMIIYWPFFNEGYSVYPHTNFLLHLVLGLNSIQVKSIEKELRYSKIVGGILEHNMKNLTVAVKALYRKTLADKNNAILKADKQTMDRFASLCSEVLFATSAIEIEIPIVYTPEEKASSITIKDLYDGLYECTRFHNFKVQFDGIKKWTSCTKQVVLSSKVVITNLIENARKATIKNKQVVLLIDIEPSECVIRVKSQEPLSEKGIQLLRKPLRETLPEGSKGIWICRTVLKLHGGNLSLDPPAKNYKTIFRLSLPWVNYGED